MIFKIFGQTTRHCDGVSRREFVTAGAAGFTGMTLANLLRAEDAAGIQNSRKAIINIHLDGGPPQMDMIDLKPDAPVEIRGEFSPIATRLPGFQICELMPQVAAMADQFAFVRSLVGSAGRHDAFQCQSGFNNKALESLGGRPALGCVVSKLKSSPDDVVPTFVDLMQGRPLARNSARPGFLGPSFKAFRPDLSQMFERELEPAMKGELARLGADHSVSLSLNPAISADRLHSRNKLLAGLDRIRRQVDASGMMDAMDRFTQQATGILTSGQFAKAMDLSLEDPKVVARYTAPTNEDSVRSYTSEDARSTQKFLLARRLIEAGVRCVSVSISDFDTHRNNFPRLRHLLPIVDHGLAALVSDLTERGMLDDVSIVVWGEFGRTPRVNSKQGGRDHWPRVGPAILAGGGMQVGQVIGATDRSAATAIARPVSYQDVFATLYHNLGIDARRVTIVDTQGRPQYLLDEGDIIRELV
jgi:uncharacterized protein (DUF1501 family)